MPIAVHCEDENTIRENLKLYTDIYGENIPIKFHSKIPSGLTKNEITRYLKAFKKIDKNEKNIKVKELSKNLLEIS